MIKISPRAKKFLTTGRTLEELRSYEKQLHDAGFRKRRNGNGKSTTGYEYFQWWDRKGERDKDSCVKCSKPTVVKPNGKRSWFCVEHLIANRERQREKLGFTRRNANALSYSLEPAGK